MFCEKEFNLVDCQWQCLHHVKHCLQCWFSQKDTFKTWKELKVMIMVCSELYYVVTYRWRQITACKYYSLPCREGRRVKFEPKWNLLHMVVVDVMVMSNWCYSWLSKAPESDSLSLLPTSHHTPPTSIILKYDSDPHLNIWIVSVTPILTSDSSAWKLSNLRNSTCVTFLLRGKRRENIREIL